MNFRGLFTRKRPRTPRDIINDILDCRYPEGTLDSYLSDHISLLQEDHDTEVNQEVYGNENPLVDFLNLRILLQNLSRNPDGEPSGDDREALSRAFDTLEMLIHHDFSEALHVFTEDASDEQLILEQGLSESGLEHYKKTHSEESRKAMDVSYKLQGLFVELCDHYGIPTKRHPPQRKR